MRGKLLYKNEKVHSTFPLSELSSQYGVSLSTKAILVYFLLFDILICYLDVRTTLIHNISDFFIISAITRLRRSSETIM